MLRVPQRYGQTDGRTTYDSNTALALRASRGKKDCLKKLPKTIKTTRRIYEFVWKRVLDRWASNRKSPTAVSAESSARNNELESRQSADEDEKWICRLEWGDQRGTEVLIRANNSSSWRPAPKSPIPAGGLGPCLIHVTWDHISIPASMALGCVYTCDKIKTKPKGLHRQQN